MYYKLYDTKLSVDDEFEKYNKIYAPFSMISSNLCNIFVEKYKNFSSLDDFINQSDSLIVELLKYPLEYAITLLSSNGIYTIDERTFLNTYIDTIILPWNETIDEIFLQNKEIDLHSKAAADYRSLRKASRGKFIGGGFGINGAVKGITTAAMLNAGTGIAHSGINAIGNLVDSVKNANKKNSILNSTDTLNKLLSSIRQCILSFVNAVAEILNVKYDYTSESNKSLSIFNNLTRIPDNQKFTYLLNALALFPYNIKVYCYLLDKYGDKDRELSNFAEHFGIIDSINEYKEISLKNLIDSTKYNNFLEMEMLLVKINFKKSFLGIDSSMSYSKFVNDLNQLKNAEKTVNGIVFDSISDAKKAHKIKDEFDNTLANLNNGSIESLSMMMNKYKSFNPKLKQLLKSQYEKLNETYIKLDIQQRTLNGVVYESVEAKKFEMEKPKRTFNGTVYNTIEEKEAAVELSKRTFNGIVHNTIEEKEAAVELSKRTFNGIVYNTLEEKDVAVDKYYIQMEEEQAAIQKKIIEEINALVLEQKIDFVNSNEDMYKKCKSLSQTINSKYKSVPKCEIHDKIKTFIKDYEIKEINKEVDSLVKNSKINFNKINNKNYEKCISIVKTINSKHNNYTPTCDNYYKVNTLISKFKNADSTTKQDIHKESYLNKKNHKAGIFHNTSKFIIVLIKSLPFSLIFIFLGILAYNKISNLIVKYIIFIWMIGTAIYVPIDSLQEFFREVKNE